MNKQQRKTASRPNRQQRMGTAFEAYFAQGEERSLERLSTQLGVPLRTLQAWSSDGNWQTRLTERLRLVAEDVQRRAIRRASNWQFEAALNLIKVLERDIERWTSGELKLDDPRALEVFAKLVRLFTELPTERLESRTTLQGNVEASDADKSGGPSLFLLSRAMGKDSERMLYDFYSQLVKFRREHPDIVEFLGRVERSGYEDKIGINATHWLNEILEEFGRGNHSTLSEAAQARGTQSIRTLRDIAALVGGLPEEHGSA